MSSDKTSHVKSIDKMETRSGTRRLNDADLEDITNRLRQKELLLQEQKRAIREREDALQITVGKFETIERRSDVHYALRETDFSIQEAINMSGRAYLAIEDYKIRTINRLCDVLCKEFGRNKTLHQYKAELCNEKRYKRGELTENKRRETDEFALTSFCEGLFLEYRITSDTCEDLPEAFAKVRKFHFEIGPDTKMTYNRRVSRTV
ncbi:enzymatic polyprotein endonuclease reverse [Vespula squamosa]|uniref:Enzymatic polyprotein endonuclease reverse n=1 Tax=Vespula squamosa TaxID=30214 RepID=A0ABD2BXX9_VESSQ